MRRGPLDRYPLDAVLRTAAEEHASGSIAVEALTAGTIHLVSGAICFATLDGMALPPAFVDGRDPGRDVVRRQVEEVVAVLVECRTGWYHHDPIGAEGIEDRWRFAVPSVLDAVRHLQAETLAARPWTGRPLRLVPVDADVRVSADAWNVVAAIAGAATAHQARHELGWDGGRLAAALAELDAAGLLRAEQAVERGPAAAPPPESVPPRAGTAPGPTPTPRPRPAVAPLTARVTTTPRPLVPLARAGAGGPVPAVAAPARLAAPSVPPAPGSGSSARRHALKRLIDSLRP